MALEGVNRVVCWVDEALRLVKACVPVVIIDVFPLNFRVLCRREGFSDIPQFYSLVLPVRSNERSAICEVYSSDSSIVTKEFSHSFAPFF